MGLELRNRPSSSGPSNFAQVNINITNLAYVVTLPKSQLPQPRRAPCLIYFLYQKAKHNIHYRKEQKPTQSCPHIFKNNSLTPWEIKAHDNIPSVNTALSPGNVLLCTSQKLNYLYFMLHCQGIANVSIALLQFNISK